MRRIKISERVERNGFTLIELLVVISIIALLLAILMPALSKARQQAKLLTCMANSRQIGVVVSIYQADNDGAVPVMLNIWAGGYAPGKATHLSLALQDYVRDGKKPFSKQFNNHFAELGGGGWLVDYYANFLPDFFVCPFARGKPADPVDAWSPWSMVTIKGGAGSYDFYTRSIIARAESYAPWIDYRERGKIMESNHPYGPPHGVLKYGAMAWYSRTSLPAGANPGSAYRDGELGPAKWSKDDLRAVKSSSSSNATVVYCLFGETLNWSPAGTSSIVNYKSHLRGNRGGTVAVFADTHVGWVPGSQIGTK